jgi:hypothetical protein
MNVRRASLARRIIPALLILAVAAGLALYYGPREKRRAEAVQRFVMSICHDVDEGREPAQLAASPSLIARRLAAEIQSLLDSFPGALDTLEVDVRSGESGQFPDGNATHHAVVRLGATPVLVIRLSLDEKNDLLTVVGFHDPS